MNFEYPPSDLQNDPADADVHDLIFTHAGVSGQVHFPGAGQLPRTQRGPRGAGFGRFPAVPSSGLRPGTRVGQRETSYQVVLGGPGEYNLTHAIASMDGFASYPAPFCFLKYFLKPRSINDAVVFMHKLISYVCKTKIGALLFVKPGSLKYTGIFSLPPEISEMPFTVEKLFIICKIQLSTTLFP